MCVFTEKGEFFIWGPGAASLPFGIDSTHYRTPVRVDLCLLAKSQNQERGQGYARVVDIAAGPRGCLLLTTDISGSLPAPE